jgi:uncharacterized membrane protein
MSQHSPEDVLDMARRQIAERKTVEVQARATRDFSWRYAFLSLAGVLLLGLIAWPGTPLNWKMYAVVHGVCAQMHNVIVGDLQLPICARNTGIYSSFLVTTLYLWVIGRGRAAKLPPVPITAALVVFVLVMAVDGFNSMLRDMLLPHLYTPQNVLRTLTGTGMGVAIAVFLIMILNIALRKDPDTETPVMKNWLELAAAVGINLLVLLAMYGNIQFMYWPIAISAWTGIVGVLYLVNLLLSSLFMGYEGSVVRISQLAKPATIAIVFTTIELGLMATARFWLEGQGMMVS